MFCCHRQKGQPVRLLLGAPFPVPSLSCFSLFTRRSALRLARCSKVPVIGLLLGSRLDSPSRSSLLAPFLLAAGVSPCAAFFPWTECRRVHLSLRALTATRQVQLSTALAVLADASTAFAIVSHPNHFQSLYFTAQSALYAASKGLFPNSLKYLCQYQPTLPLPQRQWTGR